MRLKLVFRLLVKVFIGIITYFLTVITLDLAKILLFFGLLVLFFYFGSIDSNSGDSIISLIWSRASMVTFVSLLTFIEGLITEHRYTRLSISRLGFLFILLSRKPGKNWSFVFFDWPLSLIPTGVYFSDTRSGMQTSFCLGLNGFFKYFIQEILFLILIIHLSLNWWL